MINTVSLGLAKELLELGLKIETEKWWNAYDRIDLVTNTAYSDNYLVEDKRRWDIGDNSYSYSSYPAPQTDELLAVLPDWYKIRKAHNRYYCMADGLDPDEHPMITEDKNPAEALGLMCKHLLEQGYALKNGILSK